MLVIDRMLPLVALAAAFMLTAQAEWTLAIAVGWHPWVAWVAPAAVDTYVLAAFRAGRDRSWALGLLAAAVFAAHAAPVAYPDGLPWWVAGVCSVVPVAVPWRIHELARSARPTRPARASRDRTKAASDATLGSPAAALPRAAAGTAGLVAPSPPGRPSLTAGDRQHLPAAEVAAAEVVGRGERLTRDGLVAEMRTAGRGVGAARAGRLLTAITNGSGTV
jgi:hypothetical protein